MSYQTVNNRYAFYCATSEAALTIAPLPAMRQHLHAHTFHELYYSTGRGYQVTTDVIVPMAARDLFLLPAGHPHISAHEPGERCTAITHYFPDDLFPPFVDGDDETRHILRQLCLAAESNQYRLVLTPEGITAIGETLKLILGEFAVRAPGYRSAVKSATQALLLMIARTCQAPNIQYALHRVAPNEWLLKALFYIQTHFQTRIDPATLLEIAQMGRSRFYAAFKEETGCTLTAYINTLRLDMAARLLRTSDLSVTDIAYQCGFEHLSYFYRLFITRYGQPPREFRLDRE